MGFFKDFKRDFAQAVNELIPDKDELSAEYDDEDMVNTFDENDSMDIAPEDMLENLDDFSIDNLQNEQPKENIISQEEKPESDYNDDDESEQKDILSDIPEAEILNEPGDESMDSLEGEGDDETPEPELLEAETGEGSMKEVTLEDELKALDSIDEENMTENIQDALSVESDVPDNLDELKNINLNQDVMDALKKRQEDEDSSDTSGEEQIDDLEEDNMAELEAKIEDKEQDIDSILADDTTYITKGTTINGDIETDGGIDIIGTVEGNVTCEGKLIVGGSVKGNINAGEVYANAAKLEGEVTSVGSVKIGVGSVVVGNVSAASAVVAGAVNGDIDVHGPVIVDSTAVIMGNIKSRSVQINNGAVIEGFCSQCYSEIDVKSFFE